MVCDGVPYHFHHHRRAGRGRAEKGVEVGHLASVRGGFKAVRRVGRVDGFHPMNENE